MTMPGGHGSEPGPYDLEARMIARDTADAEPVMWQREATMTDGTRILVTVWDNDPDTIEVCTAPPGWKWSRPWPVKDPP